MLSLSFKFVNLYTLIISLIVLLRSCKFNFLEHIKVIVLCVRALLKVSKFCILTLLSSTVGDLSQMEQILCLFFKTFLLVVANIMTVLKEFGLFLPKVLRSVLNQE